MIGMPVTQADCAGVMQRLGLPFSEGEGTVTVTPPSWRFDLAIEEDLIEEVARVIGYERLPATPPQAPVTARVRAESERGAYTVRRALADLGYQETINFSFVEARWEHELAGNADPIQVLNPIAAPLAVMRSSLLGGLVNVLGTTRPQGQSRSRVRGPCSGDADVASGTTAQGVSQPMRVSGMAGGGSAAVGHA
jgi:phenylalanyl-tRNA synthetase beta chain